MDYTEAQAKPLSAYLCINYGSKVDVKLLKMQNITDAEEAQVNFLEHQQLNKTYQGTFH